MLVFILFLCILHFDIQHIYHWYKFQTEFLTCSSLIFMCTLSFEINKTMQSPLPQNRYIDIEWKNRRQQYNHHGGGFMEELPSDGEEGIGKASY
jgi:hypothetical protein